MTTSHSPADDGRKNSSESSCYAYIYCYFYVFTQLYKSLKYCAIRSQRDTFRVWCAIILLLRANSFGPARVNPQFSWYLLDMLLKSNIASLLQTLQYNSRLEDDPLLSPMTTLCYDPPFDKPFR